MNDSHQLELEAIQTAFKEEVETDGIEQATFSLEAGDAYSIDADNNSSTVVFNDSLDSVPGVEPPLPKVETSPFSVNATKPGKTTIECSFTLKNDSINKFVFSN